MLKHLIFNTFPDSKTADITSAIKY